MQKLLDIVRTNFLAKMFVHIFIFNFFYMQCFAMIPGAGIYQSEASGTRVNIHNAPDESAISLKIIFNDNFTDFSGVLNYKSEQISSFLSADVDSFNVHDDGLHYFLNDGLHLSIDLAERKLFLHEFGTEESFFIDTNCSLFLSSLHAKNIDVKATSIALTSNISAVNGISIEATQTLENAGIVNSPEILMQAFSFSNLGRFNGQRTSIWSDDLVSLKTDSAITSSDTLKIVSKKFEANHASIASGKIDITADKLSAIDNCVFSTDDCFHFNGTEFALDDHCLLQSGLRSKIYCRKFGNRNSKIFSAIGLEIVDNHAFLQDALTTRSINDSIFINDHGEITTNGSLTIVSHGKVVNETGHLSSILDMRISTNVFHNLHSSLIKANKLYLLANSGANIQSTISLSDIASFMLNLDQNQQFIGNAFAEKWEQSVDSDFSEENKAERERRTRLEPQQPAQPDSQQNEETSFSGQSGDGMNDSEQEKEVGYFLNLSGEITCAKDMFISGSGAFYNFEDSILQSSNRSITLDFYGRILNSYRSRISANSELKMLTVLGIVGSNGNSRIHADKVVVQSNRFVNDSTSKLKSRSTIKLASKDYAKNFGKISAKNNVNISTLSFENFGHVTSDTNLSILSTGSINMSGALSAAQKVEISIDSDIEPNIGGIIESNLFKYILLRAVNNVKILPTDIDLRCNMAEYDLSASEISTIREPIRFLVPTLLKFKKFNNNSSVHCDSSLKIIADRIQNGYRHNLDSEVKGHNTYKLKYDWGIGTDSRIHSTEFDRIYINTKQFACDFAISSDADLEITASELLYNSGRILSKNKLILNGRDIQTGWAYTTQRTLTGLPYVAGVEFMYGRGFVVHNKTFDFPYEFYSPQASLIQSGGLEINCNRFLSTFGNIQINGGIRAQVNDLFLNLAGNIFASADSQIDTKAFVNSIGTLATNEQGKQYWKISCCNTDPATFLCNGQLSINPRSYFKNSGSHIHARGALLLNGVLTSDAILAGWNSSVAVNESKGTEYCRMYTVTGVDVSKTTRHTLGVRTGSSTTTTYWRQDFNEVVDRPEMRASLSSAQKIIEKDFNQVINTGAISAPDIFISSGVGGLFHGNHSRINLLPLPDFARKVDSFKKIATTSFYNDYVFMNPIQDGVKIPFVIVSNNEHLDFASLKLAMSLEEYAKILQLEMMRAFSTGFLPDMPTFEDAAALAYANSTDKGIGIDRSRFPEFLQAISDNSSVRVIKPSDITSGIYFIPHEYKGRTALFPELYVSPNSLHPSLQDPSGSIFSSNDTFLKSKGKVSIAADIHADHDLGIKADGGINVETMTFEDHARISRSFTNAKGMGYLYGSKTSGTYSRWESISRARSPVILSSGGKLCLVIPNGEFTELKGVLFNIGGKFEATDGSLKLTPLMVDEIVVQSNGTYIVPEFIRTMITSGGGADMNLEVFLNSGCGLESAGKVTINANSVFMSPVAKQYLSSEFSSASQSLFSSKSRREKCYEHKIAMPVLRASEIEMHLHKKSSIAGSALISEGDIKIFADDDMAMSSEAFYNKVIADAVGMSPLGYKRMESFLTAVQLAPMIFAAGGNFSVEAGKNFFGTGVSTCVVGNMIIRAAKNAYFNALRVTERNTVSRFSATVSPGFNVLPLLNGDNSAFAKIILSLHPYTAALSGLFGAKTPAQRGAATARVLSSTHNLLAAFAQAVRENPGQSSAENFLSAFLNGGESWKFGLEISDSTTSDYHTYDISFANSVGGDFLCETGENISATGLQSQAKSHTFRAGGDITLDSGMDRHSVEHDETNATLGKSSKGGGLGISVGKSSLESVKYMPTKISSTDENVFEAGGKILVVNPSISGSKNTFTAQMIELLLKYDFEHQEGNSAGYQLGVSKGKAPALTIFGSNGWSHREFDSDDVGIIGDVLFNGKTTNDSVRIRGAVLSNGEYSYSYRAPAFDRDMVSWGITLEIGPNFFASLFTSVFSSLAGYAVGQLTQQIGCGDYFSSLLSSGATAYASNAIAESLGVHSDRPAIEEIGHISIADGNHETETVVFNFNQQRFDAERQMIGETIFGEDTLHQGIPPEEQPVEQIHAEEEILEPTIVTEDDTQRPHSTDAEENQPRQHSESVTARSPRVAENNETNPQQLTSTDLLLYRLSTDPLASGTEDEAFAMNAFNRSIWYRSDPEPQNEESDARVPHRQEQSERQRENVHQSRESERSERYVRLVQNVARHRQNLTEREIGLIFFSDYINDCREIRFRDNPFRATLGTAVNTVEMALSGISNTASFVTNYTVIPFLEGSRASRAIDTSCMPWDERIGTAPLRAMMAIPSVLVDDVYPYIDNLSGNRISGAFKFAFKEEYGALQINDSLLSFGVNPRNARDISFGFEMYRRTFLDSYAVGSIGMLGRSSINALAAKGRNIFQNIGVIPGLNEKIIERCSLATREYNQLMQVSRGRADWLDPDHFRRGRVYENRVCAEDFTDMIQTPSTAQSFDAIRFSDGHAVSIKSLNTNLPSYARPSQITSTLNKYVRNIVDFERMLIPEIGEVRPNMINSCELFVGVPPEITLPQFMAAQKSIRLARQHGISLRLRIEE